MWFNFSFFKTFLNNFNMKKNLFLIILLFVFSGIFAQDFDKKSQANFLFDFGRLLQWQEYNKEKIVINVYNGSSVIGYINNLATTNVVAGRDVSAQESNITNVGSCNILFIPEEGMSDFDTIVGQLRGKSVLVVTEVEGFLSEGADVEFDYNKISATDSVMSYRYNSASIKQKNIKISPEFSGYSIK